MIHSPHVTQLTVPSNILMRTVYKASSVQWQNLNSLVQRMFQFPFVHLFAMDQVFGGGRTPGVQSRDVQLIVGDLSGHGLNLHGCLSHGWKFVMHD